MLDRANKYLKKLLLIIVLFLLQQTSFSQSKTIDSLKTALQHAQNDTTRLNLLLSLGDSCKPKDKPLYAEPAIKLADNILSKSPDAKLRARILDQKVRAYTLMAFFYSQARNDIKKATFYMQESLKIYTDIGDKKGMSNQLSMLAGMAFYQNDTSRYLQFSYRSLELSKEVKDTATIAYRYVNISSYYLLIGNFPKALEFVREGLSVTKAWNYKAGTAQFLLYQADIYRDNGENSQALDNYQNALTILYKLHDTLQLYNGLAAIGGFYYKQNNTRKAVEYYRQCIALCGASEGMKEHIPIVYGWMGQVYKDNQDYTNSLLSYNKSLDLLKKEKSRPDTTYQRMLILNALGDLYNEMGHWETANAHYVKALELAKQMYFEIGEASSYLGLARAYLNQKRYKAATDYSHNALAILKKGVDLNEISGAERLASQVDSASGNGLEALVHYKEYVSLTDKLKGTEVQKAAQRERFEIEYAQQKAIAKAQQEKRDAIAGAQLKQEQTKRYTLYGGLFLLLVFGGFMFNRFRVTKRQKQVIEKQKVIVEKEKQRSEDLLLNILPLEVAEELKEKGTAEAKQFDQVTVMFTDFKGFTQIAERLSAREIVAEIDACFKAFDEITAKHNIEKIKTIGDSYMCAGGLPVLNKTNAQDVVRAALEIQQYMDEQLHRKRSENKEAFEIRIGIHTGAVVAGIVGIKKFAYDIWGIR